MRRVLKWVAAVVLLALAGFAGAVYWAGSQLAAPARASVGAPPGDLAVSAVTIARPSGGALSGWFVSAGRSCATAVLMHPVGVNRRAMLSRARLLSGVGYDVLLFDFQAHGESGGEWITFGHLEREDARAAVAFARDRRPDQPLAVIGASLGGAAAVLNGAELGADVVVLEAVYSTLEQAVVNRLRLRSEALAVLAPVLLLQLEPRLGFGPEDLRPIDHVGALGVPVMIVAGSRDRHTPLGESRAMFERAREPKRLWIVEGAAHQNFHRYDPDGYGEEVLSFLGAHLGCP